jgi:putative CocE/NonD family hydrolase
MKVKKIMLLAVCLLFVICISCQQNATPEGNIADDAVFDFYVKGIKLAELAISVKSGDKKSYTISWKDAESNSWKEPVTANEIRIAEQKEFLLMGPLRGLPARMGEIENISWNRLKAVGWPDENSVYVRHRALREKVADESVSADLWVLKDGSSPLDLIISQNNTLIAGISGPDDFCLVRRGFEIFTTVKRWSDPSISKARYGYRLLDKFMVPMEDGVKLATLVYLPDDDIDGPFPVVFIRTPYGIGDMLGRGPFIQLFWHYCARGYAVVLQACRGTAYWDPEYRSEGIWQPCINEPLDGAKALEWIVDQSWCDGNIGMQGGSYVGYTQWACTMSGNPALKCIIPEVSMGTVFSDQPYMGGGFVEGFAFYVFWMLDKPILPGRTWTDILHHRPLIEIDSYATGEDLPQWNTILQHWRNDAYWQRQDWYRDEYSRDFATFQISGWFDDDFPGTRRNWEVMQRNRDEHQRLIIGPWKHDNNRDRKLNGYSFGHDALRDDIWIKKQKWYDRFLKDIDNGVDETVVEYFVLGDNVWKSASQWPPADVELQKWYFHSNGSAHRLTTNGKLTRETPANKEPQDIYIYDPRDPAPNWMSFDQMKGWQDVQSFPYDYQNIEKRSDIVVYTSEPLTEDLTIAGDVIVELYASCDVSDTDWWAYVSDVHPDGRSVRYTLGMIRARFRNIEDKVHNVFGENFVKEELLSGSFEDVVKYIISVPSIALTFKKGHQIRIAITNACDNYGFPNSNTGKDEALVIETVAGKMAIHHSPDYPSCVTLPVLPKN